MDMVTAKRRFLTQTQRIVAGVLVTALVSITAAAHAAQVTVYTSRNEQLIKPLFDAYTKKTGVEVRFITDKEGPLMERLKAEGKNTPADILMTVDAGNLWQAENDGLLASLQSPILEANIPAHLRDPEGYWFGFSVRARTIFYNPEKVKTTDLSSYEDLADTRWKGRLCLRTSKKVYNQSLVATLIAAHGVEKTEKIIQGWVANLAVDPFADDTKMLEAIAAGQCDVGLANTYYYGRLIKAQPHLAKTLSLFWANQETGGTHVNISGAGLTKYAKSPEEARKFLEWLSGPDAQAQFAGVNMEFPANASVSADPAVAAWGSFKQSIINVAKAGELQAEAVKLMDRAGYR